ncbi:very short patch repair endonuclease [Mesorhizobium abyssinicae]|uniref:very short patch repair endonuclease n=1 Tax=Mesorhizobium abyssinicae TaxID=1209958 RepID=UPI003391AD26
MSINKNRKALSQPPDARVSTQMRLIRKKDTKPEIFVRRIVHGMGYRYRLHRSDLPGTPDLVFPARKKVILVHGCFWHQHDCRLGRRQPKANPEYWLPKLKRNRERDLTAEEALSRLGWNVLTIWECETRDPVDVEAKVRSFLEAFI